MIIEFTCDAPEALAIEGEVRAKARTELARWLAGDHSNNNTFRSAEAA